MDIQEVRREVEAARQFAAGMEEAGYHEYARRMRVLADHAEELARQLADERSVRVAMQAERDRLRVP